MRARHNLQACAVSTKDTHNSDEQQPTTSSSSSQWLASPPHAKASSSTAGKDNTPSNTALQHTPRPPPQRQLQQRQQQKNPPDLTPLKQQADRIIAQRCSGGEKEHQAFPSPLFADDYYSQFHDTTSGDVNAPGVYGARVAWHLDNGVVYKGGSANRNRRVDHFVPVRRVGVMSLPHAQSLEWSSRNETTRGEHQEWLSILYCFELEWDLLPLETGNGEDFVVLVETEACERQCLVEQERATCEYALERQHGELTETWRNHVSSSRALELSNTLIDQFAGFKNVCSEVGDAVFREYLVFALYEVRILCEMRQRCSMELRFNVEIAALHREYQRTLLLPQFRYSSAALELQQQERDGQLEAARVFCEASLCCIRYIGLEAGERENAVIDVETSERRSIEEAASASEKGALHKTRVRGEVSRSLEARRATLAKGEGSGEKQEEEEEVEAQECGVLQLESFDAAYQIEFVAEPNARDAVVNNAPLCMVTALLTGHEEVCRALMHENEANARASELHREQRLLESSLMLRMFADSSREALEHNVLPALELLHLIELAEPVARERVRLESAQEHYSEILFPLAFEHGMEMRRRELFQEYCFTMTNAIKCAVLGAAKADAERQHRPPGWDAIERDVIALEVNETKDRVFVQLKEGRGRKLDPIFQRATLQHEAVLTAMDLYSEEHAARHCHQCELAEALARALKCAEVQRTHEMWRCMVKQGDLALLLDCTEFLTVEEIVDAYVL